MTNNLIRVIIIEAENRKFKIVNNFEHSLDNLQAVVGGYIEAVRVDDSITIWVNEEGKLQGLAPNFMLLDSSNRAYDLIAGNVIITGTDEEGNSVSLTDSEIEIVKSKFLDKITFKMF